MRTVALSVGFALTFTPMSQLVGQPAAGLEGAWSATQIVAAGPNAATNNSPPPGMWIFSGRHYAVIRVTATAPRTQPANIATATADELRAVWSPFNANAGTFEISGNRLTTRGQVAKNPDFMAPGSFNEYTFRQVADTLWLTQVRNQVAAIENLRRSATPVPAETRPEHDR